MAGAGRLGGIGEDMIPCYGTAVLMTTEITGTKCFQREDGGHRLAIKRKETRGAPLSLLLSLMAVRERETRQRVGWRRGLHDESQKAASHVKHGERDHHDNESSCCCPSLT